MTCKKSDDAANGGKCSKISTLIYVCLQPLIWSNIHFSMNPVDLPTLTQAIETLYSHSVSTVSIYEMQGVNGNSIATAERFLSEIVNDNSITIDLSNGLAQSSDIVIFGLCNIVYQQVLIIMEFEAIDWKVSPKSEYGSNLLLQRCNMEIPF